MLANKVLLQLLVTLSDCPSEKLFEKAKLSEQLEGQILENFSNYSSSELVIAIDRLLLMGWKPSRLVKEMNKLQQLANVNKNSALKLAYLANKYDFADWPDFQRKVIVRVVQSLPSYSIDRVCQAI